MKQTEIDFLKYANLNFQFIHENFTYVSSVSQVWCLTTIIPSSTEGAALIEKCQNGYHPSSWVVIAYAGNVYDSCSKSNYDFFTVLVCVSRKRLYVSLWNCFNKLWGFHCHFFMFSLLLIQNFLLRNRYTLNCKCSDLIYLSLLLELSLLRTI